MATKSDTQDTITVNGVEYVKAGSQVIIPPDSPVKIILLQRGFVMVGHFSQEGEMCTLHKASVIRIWGTNRVIWHFDLFV